MNVWFNNITLKISQYKHCCVYLSPVFPQITGLLGTEKITVNIHEQIKNYWLIHTNIIRH